MPPKVYAEDQWMAESRQLQASVTRDMNRLVQLSQSLVTECTRKEERTLRKGHQVRNLEAENNMLRDTVGHLRMQLRQEQEAVAQALGVVATLQAANRAVPSTAPASPAPMQDDDDRSVISVHGDHGGARSSHGGTR